MLDQPKKNPYVSSVCTRNTNANDAPAVAGWDSFWLGKSVPWTRKKYPRQDEKCQKNDHRSVSRAAQGCFSLFDCTISSNTVPCGVYASARKSMVRSMLRLSTLADIYRVRWNSSPDRPVDGERMDLNSVFFLWMWRDLKRIPKHIRGRIRAFGSVRVPVFFSTGVSCVNGRTKSCPCLISFHCAWMRF